jgi:hypothetical protein
MEEILLVDFFLKNSSFTLQGNFSSIYDKTVLIPSFTQRLAIPNPIPLAAPVITATLFLKTFIIFNYQIIFNCF